MVRKLPWDSAAPSLPQQPPKRAVHSQSIGRSALPRTSERHHAEVSSPSDPTIAEPSHIDPMQEGYHADDGWMMVEDEFQSLAQSLTRHLHHAEYRRLVEKAKHRPRKPLPESPSQLSKQARLNLQRASLTTKQKQGLDRVLFGRSSTDNQVSDGDKEENPLRDTPLASLMATRTQAQTSLKGLERLPSSTKAAKGYSRTSGNMDSKEDPRPNAKLGGSLPDQIHQRPEGGADISRRIDQMLAGSVSDVDASIARSPDPLRASDTYTLDQSSLQRDHFTRQARHLHPVASAKLPSSPFKKRKVMEKEVDKESRENRLAEVPMFLS